MSTWSLRHFGILLVVAYVCVRERSTATGRAVGFPGFTERTCGHGRSRPDRGPIKRSSGRTSRSSVVTVAVPGAGAGSVCESDAVGDLVRGAVSDPRPQISSCETTRQPRRVFLPRSGGERVETGRTGAAGSVGSAGVKAKTDGKAQRHVACYPVQPDGDVVSNTVHLAL